MLETKSNAYIKYIAGYNERTAKTIWKQVSFPTVIRNLQPTYSVSRAMDEAATAFMKVYTTEFDVMDDQVLLQKTYRTQE